jgi:hypothetical protein
VTEFDQGGTIVFDAHFGPDQDNYRAYRFPWVGRPADQPALALGSHGDRTTVYASWNGATEVRRWRVLGGEARDDLAVLATAPRSGFETTIQVRSKAKFFLVQAVGPGGQLLGTSVTRARPA